MAKTKKALRAPYIELRLDEIEGAQHRFTDADGNRWWWTAQGNRPDMLEGAWYQVTATVDPVQAEAVGVMWTRILRPKFVEIIEPR